MSYVVNPMCRTIGWGGQGIEKMNGKGGEYVGTIVEGPYNQREQSCPEERKSPKMK